MIGIEQKREVCLFVNTIEKEDNTAVLFAYDK
jgi:hypothetical protein